MPPLDTDPQASDSPLLQPTDSKKDTLPKEDLKKGQDILDRLRKTNVPEYIYYHNDSEYQKIYKLAKHAIEQQRLIALMQEVLITILRDYKPVFDSEDAIFYALSAQQSKHVGNPTDTNQRNTVSPTFAASYGKYKKTIAEELLANQKKVLQGYCECIQRMSLFKTSLDPDACVYCGRCKKMVGPEYNKNWQWYVGQPYKGATVKRIQADGTPIFEIRTAVNYSGQEYTKYMIDEFVDETPDRFEVDNSEGGTIGLEWQTGGYDLASVETPMTQDEVLAAANLSIAVNKETVERAAEIAEAQSCIACETKQPCSRHNNYCQCVGVTREVNGCCAECGKPLRGMRDE